MSENNNYQWYKDDYETGKINRDPMLLKQPSAHSYYSEICKKKHKGKKLNNFTVMVIGIITGSLVFGTTFAFLTPTLLDQYSDYFGRAGISNGVDKSLNNNNNNNNNSNNGGLLTNKGISGINPFQINENENATVLTVPQIAKKVGPAVVGIMNKTQVRGFWGDVYETEGSGSGIIISPDGYIVTNNHVIERGKEITVILNDANVKSTEEADSNDKDGKKKFKAKVVGADPRTDLAVIKIDAKNLPYVQLGDSSALEVGELAVAIGNPLGQEFAGSVTVGVISALNRTIRVQDKELTLIQTDAAINPGNSGGALVNSKGEVIGINTIKMAVQGVEGMGFSIPINEAKPIINDLKNSGYVKGRPLIGIAGRDVTESIAESYKWPQGIYIIQVTPFSGAELAGLQPGDIITAFNGEKVKTMEELNKFKEKLNVGDVVEVEFYRDEKTKSTRLKLSEEKNTN